MTSSDAQKQDMRSSVCRIAVIPGDGVGPEVVDEALRVLDRLADLEGVKSEIVWYPFGGDHYLKTGELMPESVFTELRDMDAILLGAIGGMIAKGIIGLFVGAVTLALGYKLFEAWIEMADQGDASEPLEPAATSSGTE